LYISPEANSNACCSSDPRFPTGTIDNLREGIEELKLHTSNGYRVRTCKLCYENEDQGVASPRIPCDFTVNTKDNIIDLDIRINNLCNFKCRMCSEEYSSAIQAETIEIYGKDAALGSTQFSLDRSLLKDRSSNFTKIEPFITNKLESVYFAGGEPLLIDEHYKILDKLLEIGNTNLQISYNTNMSTLEYKNKSIFDYWKHFSNIKVGASIDCGKNEAEYIRHGTVWDNIVQNIASIQQRAPHVKLKFASIVNSIGCESLIDVQRDYINSGIEQSVRALTTPHFLSLAALPKHHKQRLSSVIEKHINFLGDTELARQWQRVLQYMNNYDYSYSLSEFKQRMQVLDKHRNESFVDVFPQFADLYD
jgi:organic radical activating enzyme